jgi:hypothetical protein
MSHNFGDFFTNSLLLMNWCKEIIIKICLSAILRLKNPVFKDSQFIENCEFNKWLLFRERRTI